jgi:hypothetical protein
LAIAGTGERGDDDDDDDELIVKFDFSSGGFDGLVAISHHFWYTCS